MFRRIVFALLMLCLPLFVGTVVLAVSAIFVDPTTVIEIGDGNTVPEGTVNCDWNTLNGTGGVNSTTPAQSCAGDSGTLLAYSFLAGNTSELSFQTGGSKDPLDISQWKYSTTGTPDKDTLTNGYAVSYTVPASNGNHKILAFGAERFAVNGDANIGIWFFQQPVAPNGSGGFSGLHTAGDVFAVSAFTNGGGHPQLDVYAWDPSCSKADQTVVVGGCGAADLRLLFSGAGTDLCSNDAGCATVNGSQITPTWQYATKFGGGNTVPVNGFFEGGFDLTAIFPTGTTPPCFSSFLIDTRSSQAPSSVLKDFLSGSFPECGIDIAKSCNCTSFHADGSGYDYSMSGTVTVKGFLYDVEVVDKGVTFLCGNFSGTKKWGAGAGVGDCTTSGSTTFSATAFPTTNQATATGHTSPGSTDVLSKTTDSISCSSQVPAGACTPNPLLTLDKTCVTTLQALNSNVVVRVDYTGQVHNNGNVFINNVSVVDTATGTPSTQTFTVGQLTNAGTVGADKCYTTSPITTICPSLPVPTINQPVPTGAASYFPSAATAVNPGRAQFSDTVRATGTDAFGTPVASHPAGSGLTANCLICPFGFCPLTP
jgi:hypothetical protein